MSQVLKLQCPNCGAPVSIDQAICEYCKSPLSFTSFRDVFNMNCNLVQKFVVGYENGGLLKVNTKAAISAGMCYLKLGLYNDAIRCFSIAQSTSIDNSEVYFCMAIACLAGRKPFLLIRGEIDVILQYLNAALTIEERGIYHYFLAYIKYDYFERHFFNIVPNYKSHLKKSEELGTSDFDIKMLFETLSNKNPFK